MTLARPRTIADHVDAATLGCPNLAALAEAVFDSVAVHVPFTFACLATTDPASELITAAYKSAPLPMGDQEFAAAEYGAPDLNQFAEISRRPVPVGVLSLDTAGEPERCSRFRDYMAPAFGFTDELRLSCRSGGTTWGALALYRGPGEAAFTRTDADQMGSVHELLAERLRQALFTVSPASAPSPGPAVLLLDGQDRVTSATAGVPELIDDLGGWDHGCLPANLLSVAALARAGPHPASARVLARSGRWLALRAMRLTGQTHDGSLVLSVEAAAHADVGQMRLAARGLTAREQDVARLVLQGSSTPDIAASLFLSPYTVQDHLKAIFTKLGVSSRREMIAQLVLGADG